ncbi:hypothetical protein H2198_007546 [Neophaeococcomyces mojaviensis]|uniref:Uncharacterized protein n=1 Tax=Neophaeococcomyces mojaviensis TaxID=3383035 RepID=A0ACC2ZZP1_9EURO|nr:hypothetical protein H2198_007546 [Knufia sp. JES_112]
MLCILVTPLAPFPRTGLLVFILAACYQTTGILPCFVILSPLPLFFVEQLLMFSLLLQRSRQTRHQDAASAARSRGQIIDLDPTDGLPVQKYSLTKVLINQDASSDPSSLNTKSTTSAEWASQFNTPQYPWPEQSLPSFQKELPSWNQEMIRRARAGNTNAKLSVWDRKTDTWMSAAEAEKKATPLKSLHLNNLDDSETMNGKPRNGDDADSTKSAEDSENDSSNESNKSAEDEDDADDTTPFKPSTSSKRRKLASRLNGPDETRLIEIKRWVQLPSQIAEKTPERSFLAQRRPGMPPLYQPEYAQKVFGRYHSSSTFTGATGYDLGEGGGLNNASGVLAAGTADGSTATGTATPTRKNIPPRRKKKKLGGPGRRPKNATVNAMPQTDGTGEVNTAESTAKAAGSEGAMESVQTTGDQTAISDVQNEETNQDENAESGSEAEGSEEGEIDESGGGGNAKTNIDEDEVTGVKSDVEMTQAETTKAEENMPAEPVSAASIDAVQDVESIQQQPQSQPQSSTTTMAAPPPEIKITESNDVSTANLVELPQPAETSSHTSTNTSTPAPATSTIPGLGTITDPEEAQIIEENAQAITTENESADMTQIEGVSEAIKSAAAGENPVDVEDGNEAGEVDLLGGLDAAIDQGMMGDDS